MRGIDGRVNLLKMIIIDMCEKNTQLQNGKIVKMNQFHI